MYRRTGISGGGRGDVLQRSRISREEEAHLLELASRRLEDSENQQPLSEADQKLNTQLIEEARKLSLVHPRQRNRRGRNNSAELSRSQTFDDSDGDDVFLSPTAPSPCVSPRRRQSPTPPHIQLPTLTLTQPPHTEGNTPTSPLLSPASPDNLPDRFSPFKVPSSPASHQDTHSSSTTAKSHTVPSPHSHLTQIKEENLAKKRNLVKQNKMPELTESSEPEGTHKPDGGRGEGQGGGAGAEKNPTTSNSPITSSNKPTKSLSSPSTQSSSTSHNMIQHGLQSTTTSSASQGHMVSSSSPSAPPLAFPSLPDDRLRELGLHVTGGGGAGAGGAAASSKTATGAGAGVNNGDVKTNTNGAISEDTSEDNLSEQEIEEKYSSLALAFKTDSLTLNRRIELHQRSRDVAEQNIDKELTGLKTKIKTLGPFCTDQTSREVYSQIQTHLDVLEASTSRMSSKAEVHGAVQQELRMSKAIEVMIQHVENLKRLYEKEHAELEDTKKLLQGNKISTNNGDVGGADGVIHKRSFSMAPGTGLKQGVRVHRKASSQRSSFSQESQCSHDEH